jgi:hypothetical protein
MPSFDFASDLHRKIYSAVQKRRRIIAAVETCLRPASPPSWTGEEKSGPAHVSTPHGRVGPMRCYFHLVDGSEVIRDRTGIEVSGPDKARAEALQALGEQRQADPIAAQKWSGWTLTVVDSTGQPLFSIPLDDPALFSSIALSCICMAGAEALQDFADMLPNGIAFATLFA